MSLPLAVPFSNGDTEWYKQWRRCKIKAKGLIEVQAWELLVCMLAEEAECSLMGLWSQGGGGGFHLLPATA